MQVRPTPCTYGNPDGFHGDGFVDIIDFLSFLDTMPSACIEF